MRGWADALALPVVVILFALAITSITDVLYVTEETVSGSILDVQVDRSIDGYTSFAIVLDLDNGSVVVCPVQSDLLGGTLYRLYRNRKPELPRLRETARVQVGRHSGSVVCRGLASANNQTERGDGQ